MPKINKEEAIQRIRAAVGKPYPEPTMEISELLRMRVNYRDELVTAAADEALRQEDTGLFHWLESWERTYHRDYAPILKALNPLRVSLIMSRALAEHRPDAITSLIEALKRKPGSLDQLLPTELCWKVARQMIDDGRIEPIRRFMLLFMAVPEAGEAEDTPRLRAVMSDENARLLAGKIRKSGRRVDLLNFAFNLTEHDDLFSIFVRADDIKYFLDAFRQAPLENYINASMLIDLAFKRPELAPQVHTPEVLQAFCDATRARPHDFLLLRAATQFGPGHPRLPDILPTDFAEQMSHKLAHETHRADLIIWFDRLCRNDARLNHLALPDNEFNALAKLAHKKKDWGGLAILYQDASDSGRRSVLMDMYFAAAEVVSIPKLRGVVGGNVLEGPHDGNMANNLVLFVSKDGRINIGRNGTGFNGSFEKVIKDLAAESTLFSPEERAKIITDVFAAGRRLEETLAPRMKTDADFCANFQVGMEASKRALRRHYKGREGADAILKAAFG